MVKRRTKGKGKTETSSSKPQSTKKNAGIKQKPSAARPTRSNNCQATSAAGAGVPREPVDIVAVRKNISDLVGKSAQGIATKMIAAALDGQLAPGRYLFEAIGLYPATEETKARSLEDSLPYSLLKRLGEPTEPVTDDKLLPTRVASNLRAIISKEDVPERMRTTGDEATESTPRSESSEGDTVE